MQKEMQTASAYLSSMLEANTNVYLLKSGYHVLLEHSTLKKL